MINGGHVEFDGTINGKPAHLILDTGATGTTLTSWAVPRFGLSLEKRTTTARAVGGDITMQEVENVSIGIGKALLNKEEGDVIRFPEEAEKLDGVLGSTFLQKFVVTIDYEHHRMGIGSDATATIAAVKKANAQNPLRAEKLLSLPLSFDNDIPSINASIGGQPARLEIDSGDGGALTLFAPYVVKRHLRNHFRHHLRTTTGEGLGGTVSADVVRVPTLTLGRGKSPDTTSTLYGVITELSQPTQGTFADRFISGQIGARILDRYLITFDYPHSRMLLMANGHLSDPFVYDRAGFGISKQHGRYFAVAVLPNGPAAMAGIRDGDMIISIGGTPIRTIMEKQDNQYFARPIGTIRRVVYQRHNQKPVEVKVTLRELLP